MSHSRDATEDKNAVGFEAFGSSSDFWLMMEENISDMETLAVKPGILEIDRSIFDGLSRSPTVSVAAFNGSSSREAPSPARKDVSNAK
ncbi:hypothetical protein Tco_0160452 [Tanacetum coccineum]